MPVHHHPKPLIGWSVSSSKKSRTTPGDGQPRGLAEKGMPKDMTLQGLWSQLVGRARGVRASKTEPCSPFRYRFCITRLGFRRETGLG